MEGQSIIVIISLCSTIIVFAFLLKKFLNRIWRLEKEVKAKTPTSYNFETEDRIRQAIDTNTTGETETRAPSPGMSYTSIPGVSNDLQQRHIQHLQKSLIQQSNLRPQPITLIMTDKEGNQSVVKEYPVIDEKEPKKYKNKKRRLDI